MEWKEVKDFSDYEVSDTGQVRNKNGNILVQTLSSNGYLKLKLYKGHKPYTKKVHRLVAAAFLGESNKEVNHIDGNKQNNNKTNLEYVTKSENMKHAYKNGLAHATVVNRKKVYCITLAKEYESVAAASIETNAGRKEIRNVCNGKQSQTHGLKFCWKE